MSNPTPGKNPRRFACDRCRSFKLRCHRDDSHSEACQRCAKARLTCTTTSDEIARGSGQGGAHGSRTRERGLAIPHFQHSSPHQPLERSIDYAARLLATSPPTSAQRRGAPNVRAIAPNDVRMRSTHDTATGIMVEDQPTFELDGMDFPMSGVQFDTVDYDLEFLLSGSHQAPHPIQPGVSNGSGASQNGETPPTNTQQSDLAGSSTWTPPSQSGTTPSGDVGSSTATSADQPARRSVQKLGSYLDLIQLSLDLVQDQKALETLAPMDGAQPRVPAHTCAKDQQSLYINRVLNQCSKFWEIIKTMSLETQSLLEPPEAGLENHPSRSNGNRIAQDPGPSEETVHPDEWRAWTRIPPSDAGDTDRPPSTEPTSSQPIDHAMVVNLVMTYIHLLRSFRAIFFRMLRGLELAPETPEIHHPLVLPSLQFGDFQLENNLAIQVKVLIEMATGMLLRIGHTLGISPAGVVVPADGTPPAASENRDFPLPFMSDPAAVALRETILAQERQLGGSLHGGETPLLFDTVADLRRLLARRYSVV
ncbi:hypothetical protein QBC47DRAFT_457234 [Echria macrotheca]|uniref:Zn(2)-C6 fungal-type domain-containing protein n=1 Tax=Echria macrotheca TaxID=438768 RepID=A0AAJ0F889_9PEZI|nr:hypothetical protein QBC47DRAFT_457234 [Echria macrotheca]